MRRKIDQNSAKSLNSAITYAQNTSLGIKFPKLNIETTNIRGYSDAGFANNDDLKSQLGMVILLVDENHNACILHYASWKSRRLVRSILAAEFYAFVSWNGYCQIIAHDLFRIVGKRFPVHLMTDSKSIFDTVIKLSNVSEKRLTIDISSLRQSYATREIENIGHVLTKFNIGDP